MRCQFCGWDNPEGKDHCEKCNKPLEENRSADSIAKAQECVTDGLTYASSNPKATMRENMMQPGQPVAQAAAVCPECGFTLRNGECANCGYISEGKQPSAQAVAEPSRPTSHFDARKTMRPQRKGEKEQRFTLTPISEETGQPEGGPIVYEGNEIMLNRDNTDPKNPTITSRQQAISSFRDGKWSIEDKSEYQTTFVQASSQIELKSGSLILLGNQLYRFEK